jgi:hypothetical protein
MSKHVGVGLLLFVGTCALAVACGSGAAKSSSSADSGASTGHGGASGGSTGHGGASNGSTGNGVGGGISFEGGLADAPTVDGDACGSVTLTQTLQPGNVIVVFDQSDSMNQKFTDADAGDGGTSGPKWQVAENALIAALTPIEALVNGGAIFFPTSGGATACDAVVAPITMTPQISIEGGKSFVKDFGDHFSAPGWKLILGTPTVDALKAADAALSGASTPKGQSAVVLLTDGAPTCDTATADILAPVQDMFSRGIKTYAIGLPGSATAAQLLDDIAAAGGTSTYYSPADPTALEDKLATIASGTVDQCTITLSPPPQDPSLVHLVVTDAQNPNGVEIPRVDAGDGWSLSADGTTATLDGSVCTTAMNGGYTSIQFVYGCASIN